MPGEQTTTVPRRRRRRLRLATTAVILALAAAVGYWLFWDGLPPADDDLQPSPRPVAGGNTAFARLQNAVDAMAFTGEDYFAVAEAIKHPDATTPRCADAVRRNRAALELFHGAIRADILRVPAVPDSSVDLDYLDHWLDLTWLTVLHVRDRNRATGLDPAATRLLVDLVEFGHALQGAYGSLTHVLCGMHIQRLAATELITAVQRNHTPTAGHPATGPLPPARLRAWAGRVLQARRDHAGIARACRVEYGIWCADLDAVAADEYQGDYPGLRRLQRGVRAKDEQRTANRRLQVNRTKQTYAAFWRQVISQLQAPYPEAEPAPETPRPRLGSIADLVLERNYLGKQLAWRLTQPVRRLRHRLAENTNEMTLCALVLALHAWERENGRLPAQLAQLTPDHLPRIPVDAWTDAPWHYQPDRQIGRAHV